MKGTAERVRGNVRGNDVGKARTCEQADSAVLRNKCQENSLSICIFLCRISDSTALVKTSNDNVLKKKHQHNEPPTQLKIHPTYHYLRKSIVWKPGNLNPIPKYPFHWIVNFLPEDRILAKTHDAHHQLGAPVTITEGRNYQKKKTPNAADLSLTVDRLATCAHQKWEISKNYSYIISRNDLLVRKPQKKKLNPNIICGWWSTECFIQRASEHGHLY